MPSAYTTHVPPSSTPAISTTTGIMEDLMMLKLVSMGLVFLSTFLGALSPLILFRSKSKFKSGPVERNFKGRILSFCNCLAGGVFLATCFLGLFPAAQTQVQQIVKERHIDTDYPVCELLVIVGFFLILIFEKCVITCTMKEKTTLDEIEMTRRDTRLNEISEHSSEEEIFSSHESDRLPMLKNGSIPKRHHNHHQNHSGHSHLGDGRQINSLRSLVLLLALSIHSVFEGMALGLQTESRTIWYLLIAMIVHESLAAFALGASLLKSHATKRVFVLYGLIFSTMIPIGIVLGLGVSSAQGVTAHACSAVLQAFAAGIFIYVTFFEILNHEYENESDGLWKVFFTAIGFGFLAVFEAVG
ncbi:zinc transporter ZIP3-like [Anneissia japonica]|uniref:zinc transporter ZIP3-like n=1 Tax=Anneissia japonica TaxID=1529436 RepID=UPI0014259E3F|nr:zinc transporter ZIP3-like [Anneissia japonica]XP_033118302.1 zinc transporter ZIP3-like [Anneissia japonica]